MSDKLQIAAIGQAPKNTQPKEHKIIKLTDGSIHPADSVSDVESTIGQLLSKYTSDNPKEQKMYTNPDTHKEVNVSGGKNITSYENATLFEAITMYANRGDLNPVVQDKGKQILIQYKAAQKATEKYFSTHPAETHDSEGNLYSPAMPEAVIIRYEDLKNTDLIDIKRGVEEFNLFDKHPK